MKRENAIGRANVEDTPALKAYYRELQQQELGALWNVANEIEPYYPQPKSVPMLWKWRDIGPLVRKAPDKFTAITFCHESIAPAKSFLPNARTMPWFSSVLTCFGSSDSE